MTVTFGQKDREHLDPGDREHHHQNRQRDRLKGPVAPERNQEPEGAPGHAGRGRHREEIHHLAERDPAE